MYTKSINGKHEQLRNFLLFTAAVANQQRNGEKGTDDGAPVCA